MDVDTNNNEKYIKEILQKNEELRKHIIYFNRIIKDYNTTIKKNKTLLRIHCQHEWKQEARNSCYDSVSYYCQKCKESRY